MPAIRTDNVDSVNLVDLPRRRAATYQNTYVNHIEVRGSMHDISFQLSEVIDGAVIEEKARIVMSPVEAKLLMRAIKVQMTKWHAAFGPTTPDLSTEEEERMLADVPFSGSDNSSTEPEPRP